MQVRPAPVLKKDYEAAQDHDVLQEVLDWARKDLKDPKGLPAAPPERGSLDIKEVLNADYAFA